MCMSAVAGAAAPPSLEKGGPVRGVPEAVAREPLLLLRADCDTARRGTGMRSSDGRISRNASVVVCVVRACDGGASQPRSAKTCIGLVQRGRERKRPQR